MHSAPPQIEGRPPRVVVLTGAGISAESGIATFRGSDGLWAGHRIEDVATPFAWQRDPELVWKFYQLRRNSLLEVEPNPAHQALVKLEQALCNTDIQPEPKIEDKWEWEKHWSSFVEDNFILITQNVDDLHYRAGSKRVIPMHGQLRQLRCEITGKIVEMMDTEHLDPEVFIESAYDSNSIMRPHIVWFHEMPMGMDAIEEVISTADILLVIGTSGHVYPAAGLALTAKLNGAHTVLINMEASVNVEAFDEVFLGPAGKLLPELIDGWLSFYQI